MVLFVVSWIAELVFAVSSHLISVKVCITDIHVGVSGFRFNNVSSGSHTIMVQGASVTTPHLTKSVILEVPEFIVEADISGSTVTLLINPDPDAAYRCRLDSNDPVAC